jgi:TonB family protein
MRKCQLGWWMLLLTGLVAVRPLMAQSIEGTAFDTSGAVVPGARVMLMVDYVKNAETVTDDRGHFSFSGLEPGMYFVQIKQPKFSLSQQHVVVEQDRTANVYAVLTPGRMSDEVAVRSGVAGPAPGNRKAQPYTPQLGGTLDLPRPLGPPRPRYPEGAAQAGIHGTVVLYARIKLDGKLEILAVLASPDPELEAEARRAAGEMRYDPMKLNGKPVECETELRFDFQPN